MQPSSRVPHLVRGSSAALIATFAALFSHVVGGGETPGIVGVAVPLILSLMICTLLAGRTLSLLRLSASVITSQALFHTLFVLGTPTAGGGSAPSNMAHAHHHASMMLQLPGVSETTVALVRGDTAMWVSHLIGAVVTIAFLYRGEHAILRLRHLAERAAAWVRRRFVVPHHVPVGCVPARVVAAESRGWSVLSQIHASTLRRRGPPFVARVAL